MATITVKQREAKTIRFTITDADGAVDLSTATLAFMAKSAKSDPDGSAIITKINANFIRAAPYSDSGGIVGLPLAASDLDQDHATYRGELKINFSASSIDKSADINLVIERAVHGT